MGYICDMSKTAILRARVDSKKKAAAERVFEKLGISSADAINVFLGQVGIHKGIPFPLTTRPHLDLSNATPGEIEERYAGRILNATTRAALAEKPSKRRFASGSQLLKSLKS